MQKKQRKSKSIFEQLITGLTRGIAFDVYCSFLRQEEAKKKELEKRRMNPDYNLMRIADSIERINEALETSEMQK